DGPRFVPPEQASAQSATATAAIASSLTDLRMEIGRNYNLPHGTDRARYPTRAQAVAPGAGVHAVRRRLARAGDRGVHGDLLGGPHAVVDAAGNPRRVGADRGRRRPALHLSGVVVAGLPGLSHRADGGSCGGRGAMIRTTVRAGEVSQTVFGEAVSGQYFTVMGLKPRLGRLPGDSAHAPGARRDRLLAARGDAGAARVAVLSDAFWRTRLSADPRVIGRSITIGGQPFEVIGVIAGTVRGLEPGRAESVWLPVTAVAADTEAFSLGPALLTRRAGPSFGVWARLKPGVPLSQFTAEIRLIAA